MFKSVQGNKFRDFAISQRSVKTAKINILENFPVYGTTCMYIGTYITYMYTQVHSHWVGQKYGEYVLLLALYGPL